MSLVYGTSSLSNGRNILRYIFHATKKLVGTAETLFLNIRSMGSTDLELSPPLS